MEVGHDVESALCGGTDVVATGVGLDLLPAVLAARRATDGGTWRLLCPPDVVDELGRAFVLGTLLAEASAAGTVELRTTETAAARRTRFVVDDAVHALAGPRGDRTLLGESRPDRVDGIRTAATAWVDRGTPASVRMPSRSHLLATARESLDDRFADDLAALLDSLSAGALDRSKPVCDRTVLVALAARHDHLFTDVRTWADDVDVAPRQRFTEDRRALVERGLVETIRVPLGRGRPRYRLRVTDDALLKCPPEELLDVLHSQVVDAPAASDD